QRLRHESATASAAAAAAQALRRFPATDKSPHRSGLRLQADSVFEPCGPCLTSLRLRRFFGYGWCTLSDLVVGRDRTGECPSFVRLVSGVRTEERVDQTEDFVRVTGAGLLRVRTRRTVFSDSSGV
ncbi:hypothetical protein ISCGN_006440, partial [Ixodes scapularis]